MWSKRVCFDFFEFHRPSKTRVFYPGFQGIAPGHGLNAQLDHDPRGIFFQAVDAIFDLLTLVDQQGQQRRQHPPEQLHQGAVLASIQNQVVLSAVH